MNIRSKKDKLAPFSAEKPASPPHRRLFWPVLGLIILCLIAVFFIFDGPDRLKNLLGKKVSPVMDPVDRLQSTAGRLNLLVLGIGGEGHIGTDLTDTLLFLSLKTDGSDALLLSLPRDLWLPSLQSKINAAYHYGEEKTAGQGLSSARQAVSEVLGQPLHYVFLLDFDAFIQAIDLLGGVEVDVERSFDDYRYPVPGKETAEPEESRYEHLHFDAGLQLMDGRTALRYVRSRYAIGEEGSDFARSRRQQRLLQAVKAKIFSLSTLTDFEKIRGLFSTFQTHLRTDIQENEYWPFFKLALKFKDVGLRSAALSTDSSQPGGLLISPPKSAANGYQWVLAPRTGDWQEIQAFVDASLAGVKN